MGKSHGLRGYEAGQARARRIGGCQSWIVDPRAGILEVDGEGGLPDQWSVEEVQVVPVTHLIAGSAIARAFHFAESKRRLTAARQSGGWSDSKIRKQFPFSNRSICL